MPDQINTDQKFDTSDGVPLPVVDSSTMPTVGNADTQPANATADYADIKIEVPREQVEQMIAEAQRQDRLEHERCVRADKLQMMGAFVASGICARDSLSPFMSANHASIAEAAIGIASELLKQIEARGTDEALDGAVKS